MLIERDSLSFRFLRQVSQFEVLGHGSEGKKLEKSGPLCAVQYGRHYQPYVVTKCLKCG